MSEQILWQEGAPGTLPAIKTEQGYMVRSKAHTKFYEFIANHGMKRERKIDYYLWRSRPLKISNEMRHAILNIFGLKGVDLVSVREARINDTTSLEFICHGMDVIEIVSFRGLRSLLRKYQHRLLDEKTPDTKEHSRLHQIFKHKVIQEQQGGLLRQEKMPRRTWKVRTY